MKASKTPPIACTLTAGNFNDRIAWISELTHDGLRSHEQRGLVLDLRYAPEAAERVREMVSKEQECCAFLTFEMHENHDEIRLTITAPGHGHPLRCCSSNSSRPHQRNPFFKAGVHIQFRS